MMLSAHGMACHDVLQNSCKAETSAQLQGVLHLGAMASENRTGAALQIHLVKR